MSDSQMAADEAAIREQAYYLWEQDGRPDGRAAEYWLKAVNVVAANEPKPARKAAPKTKVAASKLSAGASKTKAAPVRSAKVAPDKKPKKK